MKIEKQDSKNLQQKKYYHNTLNLLQTYRDAIWSVEAVIMQTKLIFELEFRCRIEEFLDMSYAAGAALSGTNVEEQMRYIEKNQKMLRRIY